MFIPRMKKKERKEKKRFYNLSISGEWKKMENSSLPFNSIVVGCTISLLYGNSRRNNIVW